MLLEMLLLIFTFPLVIRHTLSKQRKEAAEIFLMVENLLYFKGVPYGKRDNM
jgi:hypothetical protein